MHNLHNNHTKYYLQKPLQACPASNASVHWFASNASLDLDPTTAATIFNKHKNSVVDSAKWTWRFQHSLLALWTSQTRKTYRLFFVIAFHSCNTRRNSFETFSHQTENEIGDCQCRDRDETKMLSTSSITKPRICSSETRWERDILNSEMLAKTFMIFFRHDVTWQ